MSKRSDWAKLTQEDDKPLLVRRQSVQAIRPDGWGGRWTFIHTEGGSYYLVKESVAECTEKLDTWGGEA